MGGIDCVCPPMDEYAPGSGPARPADNRIPALVSYAVLLAVLGGGLFWAFRLAPLAAEEAPEWATTSVVVRDVLTGRYTDERGVPEAPASGWGSEKQPLRFRFVPSSDQAQSGPSIERMLAFLEWRTGYHLEGGILPSYGTVVEEISVGACEVAFLTAASYARAHYRTTNNEDEDDEIEVILQVVRRGSPEYPGSDLAYRGALIVRNDSPIRGTEDITSETVVAMGPTTSGASSILPTALFNRLGIQPTKQRVKGYHVIVSTVLEGSTDVGCVWWSPPNEELPQNDARLTAQESHPDVFERTRIIGYTAWIPNEPVVVREAVPEEVRHTLARAITLYVGLLSLTEEGRMELVSVGSPVGFLPATDADFLPLLEVIDQAFANDPDGLADFMAGS